MLKGRPNSFPFISVGEVVAEAWLLVICRTSVTNRIVVATATIIKGNVLYKSKIIRKYISTINIATSVQ